MEMATLQAPCSARTQSRTD